MEVASPVQERRIPMEEEEEEELVAVDLPTDLESRDSTDEEEDDGVTLQQGALPTPPRWKKVTFRIR